MQETVEFYEEALGWHTVKQRWVPVSVWMKTNRGARRSIPLRGTEMEIAIGDLDSAYRLLAGSVIPRPIAWVSTCREVGENLAPYSFFNVVSVDPPVVMFAPVGTGDDLKDTPKNALASEEFVVKNE